MKRNAKKQAGKVRTASHSTGRKRGAGAKAKEIETGLAAGPSPGLRVFRVRRKESGRPAPRIEAPRRDGAAPGGAAGPLAAVLAGTTWYGAQKVGTGATERFDGQASGFQTETTYEGTPDEIALVRQDCLANDIRYQFNRNNPDRITVFNNDVLTGSPTVQNARVVECWDLDFVEQTNRLSAAPAFNTSDAIATSVKKTEMAMDMGEVDDAPVDVFTYDFATKYGQALCNTYRTLRLVTWGDEYPGELPLLVQRIAQATYGQRKASNAGVNHVWRINPKSQLNKLGDLSGYKWLKKPARKTLSRGVVTIEQRYVGRISWPAEIFPDA